jgi:hypothetical protein
MNVERSKLFQKYSWLKDNEVKHVIVGDDLDAFLALILYLQHNPNAHVVGIYTQYKKIFYDNSLSLNDLKKAVYIDLDVYSKNCRSLGHHIIRQNNFNVLENFENNCNLNEIVGRSVQKDFFRKYPLGTIHFLMWLYETKTPLLPYSEALIWLADSTFINAQKYENNVKDWIDTIFNYPPFQESFKNCNTLFFEEQIFDLQQIMLKKGFQKGNGQATSSHKKLTGFQCQPKGNESTKEIKDYMLKIIDFVQEMTEWRILSHQIFLNDLICIEGKRNSGKIEHYLQNISLDDFLKQENIFSFVFPFKDNINFTKDIF